MAVYTFGLEIPAYDVLGYYQGRIRQVQVRSDDGRLLEFAIEHVIPFATRAGVSGTFALQTDAHGKFVGIQRLG